MAIYGDNRALSLLAFGLGYLLVFGASCGGQTKKKKKPKKFDFPLEVEVQRTDEEPVPEVPVKLDDKVVGYTDTDGSFRGTLRTTPGTNVTLSTGEVEGYRYADDKNEKTIRLNTKKNLSGKGRSGVPILLNTVVESTQNLYMVWVKTECDEDSMDPEDCRGLPVKMEGERIAETGREGTAHFVFETEPTGTKTITIDTPESEDDEIPTYEPEDPEFKADLRSDPTIFVFEKSFEDPDAEPERTWRPSPDRSSGSDDSDKSSDDSGSAGGGDESGSDGEVINVFD